MKKIEIYSTPVCKYCVLAKDFLKKHNIEYVEYNVAADMDRKKEMVEKSGQLGVPVIDIDGQVMVGYDQSTLAELVGVKA